MDSRTDKDTKRNMMDQAPNSYRVAIPPKQTLSKEFRYTVKETFFVDDPLRSFKDQTKLKKLLLCIEVVLPIFNWGRGYNLKKFRADIIAGLTIASLCIPQDIGYSKLAHLDPQFGLYSSFVPPLIYAFMGSSCDIAIGPLAVVSLLMGTLLSNEIDLVTHKAEYQRLAFTATLFFGIYHTWIPMHITSVLNLLVGIGYFLVHVNLDLLKLSIPTAHLD